MATENNTPRLPLSTVSRYDLVLAVFPVAFILSAGVTMTTSLPLQAGIFIGAVIALLAMLDGLFLNPPA